MPDRDTFVGFAGRRVLVTGASSGIGRAIAIELSRCGASLLLSGRNVDRLEQTASALEGTSHQVLPLDLLEMESIHGIVRQAVDQGGRLYGLCHCAGMVETLPLSAIKLTQFRRMMEINVTAGFELSRVFSRRDVMSGEGGSILFISSIYGLVGQSGQIAYSATKGALHAAARAMAVELARRNIRVNTLSPGLVHTPLSDGALAKLSAEDVRKLEAAHPLGPGQPEDVARAAVFMLAPQNRWITGTDLVIDGGYTAR
jgi:NAD(P)-dependent dehydrogenase (short-subunit alcohol dehydrogenase family)